MHLTNVGTKSTFKCVDCTKTYWIMGYNAIQYTSMQQPSLNLCHSVTQDHCFWTTSKGITMFGDLLSGMARNHTAHNCITSHWLCPLCVDILTATKERENVIYTLCAILAYQRTAAFCSIDTLQLLKKVLHSRISYSLLPLKTHRNAAGNIKRQWSSCGELCGNE